MICAQQITDCPKLSDAEAAFWQALQVHLDAAPFVPPRVRDIARADSISEEEVRRLMKTMARFGYIYEVAHDHYFSAHAVAQLAEHVDALCLRNGAARAAMMRDAIGGGRKVAIQILEFFDRVGYTRRVKDEHVRNEPGSMWQWVTRIT